jgi:hypothetical protein
MKIYKNINIILISFVLLALVVYYIKKQNIKEGVSASDIIHNMQGLADYIESAKRAVGVIGDIAKEKTPVF